MSALVKTPEWLALKEHQKEWRNKHLRDLFAQEPKRFQDFSYLLDDEVLFDFSKQYLTGKTFSLLIDLAKSRNIQEKISIFFNGSQAMLAKDPFSMHTALRDPNPKVDSVIAKDIAAVREKMNLFVRQVRSGEYKGYNNQAITDIVHVGVGGSILGPKLAIEALDNYVVDHLNFHFVSSLDGEQAAKLITNLNPPTTLFIFVSKSFKTDETLINATIFKEWFHEQVHDTQAYKKHFFAVSADPEAMTNFGIPKENQFDFWNFISGRYSVWSAVGLVIALAIGSDQFAEFLDGAYRVDQHFLNTPLEINIPVIMGLLTVWYRDFMGFDSQVIMPYAAHLVGLPAYLQQLEMESCGKSVTRKGEIVDYKTGQVIWGETDGEHSFFQLLHQGTDIIPVDFIVPISSVHNLENAQDFVLAHALAQARVLMLGREDHELVNDLLSKGISPQEMQIMAPQRSYPGNKPSTMILFPSLTPRTLGSLIACYEHKVFTQSILWDINPFDQWGVELGKKISKKILPVLRSEKIQSDELDASTDGLLKFILSNRTSIVP